MRFTVTFDGEQRCGHPYGVYQGYKVIPSHHSYAVVLGDTWEVELQVHWESGDARPQSNVTKEPVRWGAVMYVWPMKRVKPGQTGAPNEGSGEEESTCLERAG